MDDGQEDGLSWLADGLASAVLAGAIGFCLLLLGQAGAGVVAAAVTGLLTLAALRQIRPEPRRFRLPAFEAVPALELEESSDELLLTELVEEEALLLDDPLEAAAPESRVVQLFAARPLPTPGELQQRIAAHLAEPARSAGEGGTVLDLEIDAAAALRQALGELRRNLA